ncbi:MAG: UDP-glucuronic acid decarboxylase family protein [Prochlorococcaceae cyanobacterium]
MRTIMRHLVTGGAGFIGSHLIDRLLGSADNQVICLDNFQTGHQRNIAHWLADDRFQLIRHDVREPIEFAEAIDRIWHLACPASPPQYQKNPIATIKTNVIGTLNMLGLAKCWGSRLLLASTSEVYGDPLVTPQSESYWGHVNCTGPRACYDEGKRIAETLTFDYQRVHGLAVRVARIFNTYGPRMASDDGRVVTNFIHQALSNQPLTVYGDGSQTRSFCYVDDLVRGLLALMESDCEQPVNLGNPDERKVVDLASMIIQRIRPGLAIKMLPLPTDDPQQRCPDIQRAQQCLGWTPQISLARGLERTLGALNAPMQVPSAVPLH